MKSGGTTLSASGPLIYSLGIHPFGFMVLNQCYKMSMHRYSDHLHVRIKWKPSSQRKPLGKRLLLGQPVKRPVGAKQNEERIHELTIILFGSIWLFDFNWPIIVADSTQKISQYLLRKLKSILLHAFRQPIQ